MALLIDWLVATTALLPRGRRLAQVLLHRPALTATRSVKHAAPSARQCEHQAAEKRQRSSQEDHARNARPAELKRQAKPPPSAVRDTEHKSFFIFPAVST
jgi:hypothetical protein